MSENRHEYVQPRKVSPTKVTNYIRSAYLDGKTRLYSYATEIDPNVYQAPYRYQFELIAKLEARDDFEDLKSMVVEEDQKDMLLRSSSAQRKAFDLLMSTIEAAQQAVTDNPTDPKALQAASGVLKTLAPALSTISSSDEAPDKKRIVARKARVAKALGSGL